jgi:AAA ATPase domain
MDLLERSSPLGELGGLLAATAAGGRVALVAGEAGVGKSSLVRRFGERHAHDARFLVGACDPLLAPRALGPLHDVARQAGGRLAALLAAGSPRERVFAAFLDELDQPARRQVVVVEDAHWADEATLDLLVFLGRRIARTRALLLVTYRDDEVGTDHPLRAVVGSLPRETVRRVRLPPLSPGAVTELARRAGRPAAGLHALTGGNPLLVTEVLAAGEPGVPMTVRDLVLARLGRLPEAAREVARLVAVVPTRAELWLLEAALRPDPAAVEGCVAAGVLTPGEDTVGYRHELLRQAAASTARRSRRWRPSAPSAPPRCGPRCWRWPGASTPSTTTAPWCCGWTTWRPWSTSRPAGSRRRQRRTPGGGRGRARPGRRARRRSPPGSGHARGGCGPRRPAPTVLAALAGVALLLAGVALVRLS